MGDERTCPRCSFFNGQTFRTAPAMSLVRRALGPEELRDVREIASSGWLQWTRPCRS